LNAVLAFWTNGDQITRLRRPVVAGLAALALVVVAACTGHQAVLPTTASTPGPTSTSESGSPPTAATTPSTSGSSITAAPCGRAGAPPVRYDHVVWIWMENHSVDEILGAAAPTPFERGLAAACGAGTAYRAVGSPSLPNYIGATSGSTNGIFDDASPSVHPVVTDNLFRQVRDSGGTARSYEEAMRNNCQLESSGTYAVKHNPQAYFADASDRVACQRDNVPLGDLTGGAFVDALTNGTLPTFSFITPDLCHDTHDCGVAEGDRWLEQWITPILASSTYRDGRTAVFIVWDEPTPMPVIVISPTTPSATSSTVAFDHYSLLRTTEELLGLGPALGKAAVASSMRTEFRL
jgi:Phosphoesterase family